MRKGHQIKCAQVQCNLHKTFECCALGGGVVVGQLVGELPFNRVGDGFDAFVRSEREVAAMLRGGRMRVLDSEAIVGRALDKILVGNDLQLAA